jgi:LuxR family quorum sensing-dependent transcriptional regulator
MHVMQELSQPMLDFVAGLDNLCSAKDVVAAFQSKLGEVGVEHASVLIYPERGQKLGDIIVSGHLPEGFVELYDTHGFIEVDGSVTASLRSPLPFMWESAQQPELSPRMAELVACVSSFNIEKGLVIPVWASLRAIGICWLGGRNFDLKAKFWPFAQVVGAYVFERIRSLGQRAQSPAAQLSLREREVLVWVAKGKSAWEIGEILGIGSRTVETHITSVLAKLRAGNRPHAVALAMRDRLIAL